MSHWKIWQTVQYKISNVFRTNIFPEENKYDFVQSGRCSPAKHGGAYFSAVYGFMKDPTAAPGPYENQEV